jgi:integrase
MTLSTLTAPAIAAATKRAAADGKAVVLKDPGQPGLELRIGSSGTRVWCLQCRDAKGQPRRFTVGAYPEVGLAEARVKCRALRERVREGANPVAEARKQREDARNARNGIGTLAGLIGDYARQEGEKAKTWPEARRRIERVFADHLRRPLGELTLEALQRSVDGWESTQSAVNAVKRLRPILKWASRPGRARVPRDLVLIDPPRANRPRQRILTRKELARLLPVLQSSASPYGAMFEFILLTACRRDEAASARWRDINFDTRQWLLQATKNGQAHVVPLSKQAMALLRRRLPAQPDPDRLVFTVVGGKLDEWHKWSQRFMTASETVEWTRHDLRRTAATMMGEMLIDPHVVEAALGHVTLHTPLAAVYNRARYQAQVAEALQRLADALDRIVAGEGEVIPLHAPQGA